MHSLYLEGLETRSLVFPRALRPWSTLSGYWSSLRGQACSASAVSVLRKGLLVARVVAAARGMDVSVVTARRYSVEGICVKP